MNAALKGSLMIAETLLGPSVLSTAHYRSNLWNTSQIRHTVSMDGKVYHANDRELALLRTGMSPDDLQLCEAGDDEDPV